MESIATCPHIKLYKWTIHLVRSSDFLIFRHSFPLAPFQTIKWSHKNNICTLWLWPPSLHFKKIINFPTVKEIQPTIFWPIEMFTYSVYFLFTDPMLIKEWKKMYHEKIFILCDVFYTLFFIRTQFIKTSKLKLGKENKNKKKAMRSSNYAQ